MRAAMASLPITLVALAALAFPAVGAEEPAEQHGGHAAEAHPRHLVTAFLGATHEHGEDAFTFGVEYVYGLVPGRIGVGGIVERAGGQLDADLALALVHFETIGNLYVSGGAGVERRDGEHEWVGRIGAGYEIELGAWVLAPEVNLDFIEREEAVVYGVGLGRKF